MISTHSPPKKNYVTMLAIYDENSPSSKNSNVIVTDPYKYKAAEASSSKLFIPVEQYKERRKKTHFVEVKNLDKRPSPDLQVETEHSQEDWQKTPSKYTLQKGGADPQNFTSSNTIMTSKEQTWRRNNARKSRITDTFLDAKERIEQEQLNIKHWQHAFDAVNYRFQRIVLSADSIDKPIGLEISAVPNPEKPSHLLAVEIRTIDKNGRFAEDGRLRVGDQIVEINGILCEQISFARARLHLRELQSIPEPSLFLFRRISQIHSQIHENKAKKNSPNENTNTSQIGKCVEVKLTKCGDGFGFSYAGRINARDEHLYYIKGLRRAQGLSIGDRILQIDGIDLSNLNQSQITTMLKTKAIGQVITLLISRTDQKPGEENKQMDQKNRLDENSLEMEMCEQEQSDEDKLERQLLQLIDHNHEIMCLEILLNETPGAGLGISVKAQRKRSKDMGLYVRSILHGSAAYKDGRLRINELVAIETENLLLYSLNGEALDAFMRKLANLPKGKPTVRIYIARVQQTGIKWGSDSELSQSEVFIRDSATRRSISEKRPFGLHTDPAQLRAYQRIVHKRQTSAPTLTSGARSRRSLHESGINGSIIGQKPTQQKIRPKSTFYVETESNNHSHPLHSPKIKFANDSWTSKANSNTQRKWQETVIPNSKSQPEGLKFLTGKRAVPMQNELNEFSEAKTNQTKRRSSLGSGLLKLIGGKSHTCKDEQNSKLHQHHPQQQQWRPNPPPYHYHWPPLQHLDQSTSMSGSNPQTNQIQFHSNSLHWSKPLRRSLPQGENFHGPGHDGVRHYWQDATENLGNQHQQYPRHQSQSQPTIINHSMYGSRLDPVQVQMVFPAISDHPHLPQQPYHHHHQFHYNYTLSTSPSNRNSRRSIGKSEPSALFYDNSGSHLVIP